MNRDERKAAIAAYKERKSAAGIYEVRCAQTGERWVGATADLRKIANRLWFTLRQGTSPHRSLQAAWRTHGEPAFTFAPLEQLDDALSPYVRERTLEERLDHWREKLAAEPL